MRGRRGAGTRGRRCSGWRNHDPTTATSTWEPARGPWSGSSGRPSPSPWAPTSPQRCWPGSTRAILEGAQSGPMPFTCRSRTAPSPWPRAGASFIIWRSPRVPQWRWPGSSLPTGGSCLSTWPGRRSRSYALLGTRSSRSATPSHVAILQPSRARALLQAAGFELVEETPQLDEVRDDVWCELADADIEAVRDVLRRHEPIGAGFVALRREGDAFVMRRERRYYLGVKRAAPSDRPPATLKP
jgi:hypothetical protein